MKPSTRMPSLFLSPVLAGRLAAILFLVTTTFFGHSALAQTGYTGIFGGGPFYKNASANITEIENSGFTEAIVWSVEVNSVGDLNFNGEFPLTSGGAYVGNSYYPNFPADMARLKQGSVKRVTFSVGSSNYGDWENITALVQSQGIGPTSILYKDFAALKTAIPALDAIDFDDENSFNSPTTIQFAVMLGQLGYHVMPDPFDNSSYWTNVVAEINSHLPGTVDGVHLQAYAGGAGNNPCVGWNFGTVQVFPGLWDLYDTPSQVYTTMSGWHEQCGIIGGFMWLYDDFVGTGLAARYANAINTAVSGSGFRLSGPSSVYVNQHATATAKITITDFGGFNGNVTLSVSGLPHDVKAFVQGTGNQQKVVFAAGVTAATGFAPITITGTSGSLTQTLALTLAVSAGVGSTGKGKPLDLSSKFDAYGIYQDGVTYTTGGLDGVGYSYSENLLGTSRLLNGVLFKLGPANALDAVQSAGQSIALPAGKYAAVVLLGTAVNGNQLSQTLTVTYTDGSTSQVAQNFSDWYTPQQYSHEYEAVIMPYRNFEDGTKDRRVFSLYAYPYPLNSAKTVLSIALPNDPNVMVFAGTLVP